MRFSEVMSAMEQGRPVTRRSWEHRQLVLIPKSGAADERAIVRTTGDQFEPWQPTVEDLFANDWQVGEIRPCNCCGLPCGVEEDPSMGLIDATVSGGYGSTPGNGNGALDDCTTYSFSLCEFCLDWLFALFRIPPRVVYMNGPDDDEDKSFRPAHQRVTDDAWRRGKEMFFAEAKRRDEARRAKT